MKIAVLMTCHNRCSQTLACLRSLCAAELELRVGERKIDVFIVDDGSTDGTAEAIKEFKPHSSTSTLSLHLISGNGNLYWAKGMHLAWRKALEEESLYSQTSTTHSHFSYDGFLWLNDDVILKPGAMNRALADWKSCGCERAVLVGAFSSDASEHECSYGVTDDRNRLVPPRGHVVEAKGWFCGNFVLVPRKAYEAIGMISGEYTHARADFDFAERLRAAGIPIFQSASYLGVCRNDFKKKMSGKSIWERVTLLWRPGYYNLHDMWLFRRKHYGRVRAIVSCVHLMIDAVKGVK